MRDDVASPGVPVGSDPEGGGSVALFYNVQAWSLNSISHYFVTNRDDILSPYRAPKVTESSVCTDQ